MDYDFEIGRMKETLALVIDTQLHQAVFQKNHSENLASVAQMTMGFGQSLGRVNESVERVALDLAKVTATVDRVTATLDKMAGGMAEHERRMQHIELTLSEIGDKLNGLIGYMDGMGPAAPAH
jgi:methyl-accepting chemotaxis protein